MIIIFDRKQDFYDLAKESDLLYFLLDDFEDNWCAPPEGVTDMVWFNILAEILTIHFELRIAGQALLTDALKRLTDKNKKEGLGYPTIGDLAKNIVDYSKKGTNRIKEPLLRVNHRLCMVSEIVGSAACSDISPDWQKLIKNDWALSLAGLATSLQNLCIAIYFAKLLLYRVYNNLHSEKLETLFVLDEASTIFPKSGTKKTALLLDYFQQARAFGIGVIFASQSMNLADEVFANTAIKVAVGGFGHGSDHEAFGSAVGLNRPQRDYIRTISQPGAAVVKDIRFPYPFTVQIER